MNNKVFRFSIKNGLSPEFVGAPLHVNAGKPCILVFDNNACVGIVWEHYENRKSDANGQAEIRFFDRYSNAYGFWHRMFIGKKRITYKSLQTELDDKNEYVYYAKIKQQKAID